MKTSFQYGNWVRRKILLILGLATLVMGALACLPFGLLYRLIMACLFVFLLGSFLFPLYSYVMFSQRGGRFQEKIYDLIVKNLGAGVDGRILDIGCGNGVLAVTLAQRHPAAEILAIDYWGKDWEYSRGVCEQNARVAGVEDRVHFQKGDAAALEFAADTFAGATSNLTFHEVRSVADKRRVLQEALRVVKPGGAFAFVDYFYEPKYYGPLVDFERYLDSLDLAQFELKPLKDIMAIPILLRHPRTLGRVGIIYGRK